MVYQTEHPFFSSNQQMMKRPVSAVGYKRPLSQHARTSMMIRPEARYRVSPDVDKPSCVHPPDQGNVNFRGLIVSSSMGCKFLVSCIHL